MRRLNELKLIIADLLWFDAECIRIRFRVAAKKREDFRRGWEMNLSEWNVGFFGRRRNDCESTSVSLSLYTTARSRQVGTDGSAPAGKVPFGGGASGIKEILFRFFVLFLLFRLYWIPCIFSFHFFGFFDVCCGRGDTQIEVGGDRRAYTQSLVAMANKMKKLKKKKGCWKETIRCNRYPSSVMAHDNSVDPGVNTRFCSLLTGPPTTTYIRATPIAQRDWSLLAPTVSSEWNRYR